MTDRQPARPCGRKPRGTLRPPERMLEALRLQEDGGWDTKTLALKFGVAPSTMTGWLEKARDAQADERNLRRMG